MDPATAAALMAAVEAMTVAATAMSRAWNGGTGENLVGAYAPTGVVAPSVGTIVELGGIGQEDKSGVVVAGGGVVVDGSSVARAPPAVGDGVEKGSAGAGVSNSGARVVVDGVAGDAVVDRVFARVDSSESGGWSKTGVPGGAAASGGGSVPCADSIGSVHEASSHGSWADECEEAFGGTTEKEVGDCAGSSGAEAPASRVVVLREPAVPGQRFYSEYVRTLAMKGLKAALQERLGIRVWRSVEADLALTTYSAGTMPAAFVNGRERLKMLAVVGDAALSYVGSVSMWSNGGTAESAQQLRARLWSDLALGQAFSASAYAKFVSTPASVNLGATKTGATAAEAVAGFLAVTYGMEVVRAYAVDLGLAV